MSSNEETPYERRTCAQCGRSELTTGPVLSVGAITDEPSGSRAWTRVAGALWCAACANAPIFTLDSPLTQ